MGVLIGFGELFGVSTGNIRVQSSDDLIFDDLQSLLESDSESYLRLCLRRFLERTYSLMSAFATAFISALRI